MMNYLNSLIEWYNAREIREKLLILLLGISLIYAVFYLLLFRSTEAAKITIRARIEATTAESQQWTVQISALKKIPQSPLYQQWLQQHKALDSLHTQYQAYLKESPSKQWSTVIKTILASHQNITLDTMKNLPEASYKPSNVTLTTNKLYQQQLNMSVYSNYNDTINYLEHLETALPHILWNKLEYTVMEYPLAKVEMEFLIIYDKASV